MNKINLRRNSVAMCFGGVKTALLVLVAAIGVAAIVLDSLYMSGAIWENVNMTLSAVSLACSVVIMLFALEIIFVSRYNFKDSQLVVILGIFADKFAYGVIDGIKENSKTRQLQLVVKTEDEYLAYKLYLTRKGAKKFVEKLKEHIPDLTVEPFTPEEKKKK